MKNMMTLLLLGLGFAFVIPVCRRKEAVAGKVRYPVRAGQFYPSSAQELREEIRTYLAHAAPTVVEGDIVALWVPHAGYMFSGQTAAHAYRLVQGKAYDSIILVGPSHYAYLDAAALGDFDVFRTPLGDAKVDTALSQALAAATPLIKTIPAAHDQEHSTEVQIPFLQTVLPDVPIVPIVIGSVPIEKAEKIAKVIAGAAKGKRVLLVASSDMSHFPNAKDARAVDSEVIKAVSQFDPRRVMELAEALPKKGIPNLDCALCGASALVTVMLAAKEMGADSVAVLPYANSADVSGDMNRVVGYGAAAFVRKSGGTGSGTKLSDPVSIDDIPFSKDEKKLLMRIAREGALTALERRPPPDYGPLPPNLMLKRGVFVTLTNRGRLRGCLGHFEQDFPLWKIVQQMASAAATQDYRFLANPVTAGEMGKIDIKISILSDLRRIRSIDEIVIGKHGVWVKQNGRSGTYLPEVATELGWNREEFLSHCCAEKAGLPADAWKRGAEIYIYSSQILGEKE